MGSRSIRTMCANNHAFAKITRKSWRKLALDVTRLLPLSHCRKVATLRNVLVAALGNVTVTTLRDLAVSTLRDLTVATTVMLQSRL